VDKGAAARLGKEVREYFRAEHAFFLSSGKAAFFLILSALKEMRNRKKVIIPAYTCFTVPSAIRKAGLEIVPCDVREETLDFDPDRLEGLCDGNTLCVVPTHLFGIPSDVKTVRRIAEKHGIFVVEDSAQAMGVRRGDEALGAAGDAAFFSFGRGKNITCGSGGLIITSSGEIAGKIRRLQEKLAPESFMETVKTFVELSVMTAFLSPYLYWFPDGLPFLGIGETRFHADFPVLRMNGFKAELLRNWRTRLEELNGIRMSMAERYIRALRLDKGVPIYSSPFPCIRFPVLFRDASRKDAACGLLRHLGVSPMYPAPVHGIREIRDQLRGATCPGAERIAGRLATLPTHALVSGPVQDSICAAIGESLIFRSGGATVG
jgi:dTDP-4-amino-4,6-dideoxygalactose transaminase